MSYKNGNYCAFYVAEPFNESALGAYATKDFVYYNLLRTWKGSDSSFPSTTLIVKLTAFEMAVTGS